MAPNMGFPKDGETNQGCKLYLTSLIMILSAGVFVIMRVVARFQTDRLAADDYTIIASLAFSIFLSVAIQLAVVHGYGQHQADLSKEQLRTCLKFFWIAQTPYKIVVCLNKTSAILLSKRIFITRSFQWLCYGALAIVIGSGIATSFATIFQCVPLEKSWNKKIDGKCIDSSMFWLANAVLNISTDVVVLALPIREIFKLHLKLQEKMLLCGVFLLGGFVTVTSILRVTAVANSVRNQKEQTWNFIERGMWTLIEANLGIICTCVPALRQLVKRLFPSMFSRSSAGYGYGASGSGGPSNTIGGTKRSRQHYNLEDTVDDEGLHMHGRKAGGKGGLYPMSPLSQQFASDDRRKSDEKHIMSTSVIEREGSQNSAERMDMGSGWPLDQRSGITRKLEVDIQVSNHPPSPMAR